jgi:hypothetical protein
MIIGIDIGVQGAIAILDKSGALVEVHDLPVLKDGPAGRRAINAPLLASIVFKSHADHAFVEGVGARPGEGAVGGFRVWPGQGCYRRRVGRRWRSLHVYSAGRMETRCGVETGIKGRG